VIKTSLFGSPIVITTAHPATGSTEQHKHDAYYEQDDSNIPENSNAENGTQNQEYESESDHDWSIPDPHCF
jgi:hypothetical protein